MRTLVLLDLLLRADRPGGGLTNGAARSSSICLPVKQFKNVTLSHSSCNLKMLPVAVAGRFFSDLNLTARYPAAGERVGRRLVCRGRRRGERFLGSVAPSGARSRG